MSRNYQDGPTNEEAEAMTSAYAYERSPEGIAAKKRKADENAKAAAEGASAKAANTFTWIVGLMLAGGTFTFIAVNSPVSAGVLFVVSLFLFISIGLSR